jgi:low affinity Fe/Cu permease
MEKPPKEENSARSEGLCMSDIFRKIAQCVSVWAGSGWAFITALVVVICWGATGPIFDYSDTWQLVINTGTTIVTFLIVFLIQNTQNRSSTAIQLKLDELLRAVSAARTSMMDLEELSDEELEKVHQELLRYKKKKEKEHISKEDESGATVQ